ncbi:DUF2127 domain-containing protein [Geomonas sp. Red69]|uniref:DUF2127 domain-containing protein n=1 Tax=Geomonas diazotrophica TaxID=2843197 RepID=UPI001C1174DD|nr:MULTISPECIES: DUF2127 domain-containing protein [Geomonas]MBU5638086.1 DUF2127 domain-containing protein [Geomonas diazotrophica]QXE86259.1 DUF2127 domain-containing protein [Geomonas nitrogeniifigens]
MPAKTRSAKGRGLRVVAVLEALKGAVVLLAGCGVLTLVHRNLHDIAVRLVLALHMNPARHYPSIFIDAANRVTDLQLWMLALSALAYASVRLVEGYGLWHERKWAEWFGFLSGAVYLPVELFEIFRKPDWPRVAVFLVNVGVVGYLASALKRSRKSRR